MTTSRATLRTASRAADQVDADPAGVAGATARRGSHLAAAVRGSVSMMFVGSVVALTGGVLRFAPVFAVQSLRYALAAIALLVFVRVFRARLVLPHGREWIWIVAGSATGLVAFNVALVVGTAHADPAVLGAAVACVPVVLAVLSPLLRRRAPSLRIVAAAVVVALGAVAVEGGGHADGLGIAMAVVLMLCEAAFTLLGARVIDRVGSWTYSLATTTIAAVACGAISVGFERAHWPELLSVPVLLGIVYAGAIATASAYVLWFTSVGRVGAAVTGLTGGFAPPTAALLGVLFGADLPSPIGWMGMAAIAVGLAWGFAAPRAADDPLTGRRDYA
ncbi:DMT family transporter [Planctomonas sp. JC2975]|uniref:DMT family transporter n=1 Tax=Planctomonas sp. JC2975 TaxID=2729626 RepID=UPI0014745273|nr:DMT family transporter [Planctomonas sp. JC2975]NNC11811.1 DMT family transporter [Planctomonas sp. JC2975]